MNGGVNLNSARAKKARIAKALGTSAYKVVFVITLLLVVGSALLYLDHNIHLAYLLLAGGLLALMIGLWYKRDLLDLKPKGHDLTDRLSADVLARLNTKQELNGANLWDDLKDHWHINFLTNHLFIPKDYIGQIIASDSISVSNIWSETERLVGLTNSSAIEPIHIAVAMMNISPNVQSMLRQNRLEKSDCEELLTWLGRVLDTLSSQKPYLGGIGRDWQFGFTNFLNRFGYNISQEIKVGGGYFSSLTHSKGVEDIKNALASGATAIALVGEDGVGKTSHVYALAQSLLTSGDRGYHQIVELDPSVILSTANAPGYIEQIVTHLLNEASAAGHIILFFDDAQRFFASGIGTFDIAQILLPIAQAGKLPIILAMNPHDFQSLKASHASFANLLRPITIKEPNEAEILRILEDTALGLEHKHNVLIPYLSIKEAYKLSGRYEQDLAYPGKAISLLTQSISQAQDKVVTPLSVQEAIEQAYGVKVSSAQVVEADSLLNLEDSIHSRMINQNQAVSVVANAIRRARAGVADPRRPFGSFLFLGPTGVGKTELAKAVADIYFGSESNMIRLDMSEYQGSDDAKRLLSNGHEETKSLILAVRQQPFSVVLLDEIEKAHPNILNLLLQLLDEGHLTDSGGRSVSFKDCIIIATSNAESQLIRDHIEKGEQTDNLKPVLMEELMKSGPFKPELLNRFDEIVVFRPLNKDELYQVVELMMKDVNRVLANQKVNVSLTHEAVAKIVEIGYDPALGARPMRRAIQESVENVVADRILKGQVRPGDHLTLDVNDLGSK